MFCTNCGTALPDGTAFCTECGARIEALPEQPGAFAQTAPQATAQEAAQAAAPVAQNSPAAYAYADPEPAGMAPVEAVSRRNAGGAGSSKKKAAVVAAIVVAALAIAGIAAWLVLGGAGSTTANGVKKHLVSVTNSVEGLDTETGTKIPLQVTGTDANGNAYDERFYVDDAGFELPEGSYTISVPASPIAADGTIYSTDGATVEAKVDENGFDTEGGLDISLEPIAAADVTDEQIEAAYEAAKDGGAASEEAAEALKNAATERRDEAIAQKGSSSASSSADTGSAGGTDSKTSAIADAQARGLTVYEGTVRVFQTTDDLAAFQGKSNPNPGSNYGPYTVLVFDSAIEVTALRGGDPGSRSGTATMILLQGSQASTGIDFSQYDGQSIVIGVDGSTSNLRWPSGADVPLGEPSASNAELVWVG